MVDSSYMVRRKYFVPKDEVYRAYYEMTSDKKPWMFIYKDVAEMDDEVIVDEK